MQKMGDAPRMAGTVASYDTRGQKNADGEEIGFMDALKGFVDIINPLQHLPVVGTFYREVTGDQISPLARLAGDALFGGPIGAALALADIAIEDSTGKDIGQTMLAMAGDTPAAPSHSPAPAGIRLAAAAKSQDFLSTATPTKPAMEGNTQMVSHSYSSTPPFAQPKNGTSALTPPTATEVQGAPNSAPVYLADSTPVLSSQDAPDGSGRTPVPPGLIAERMMAGLDAYAAMMQARTIPTSYAVT